MLNIALTFDYEVFFRENIKSTDKILFDSADKILDILDQNNVKATFFIDTLSFKKFKEIGDTHYCERFKKQCVEILKRGHNAQLHIHAHWLCAEYDSNKKVWSNDINHYRLQSYSQDIIERTIEEGIAFLNECAEIAKVDYNCNAFRAGGLTFQPEKKLIETLVKKGIEIDSSIAPNTVSKNVCADYDYRQCPKKLNWHMSSETGYEIDDCNSRRTLFEIPVATVKNNILRYLFLKKPIRIANADVGGCGFYRPKKKNGFFAKFFRRFSGYSWISLDTRAVDVIISDLRKIYKDYHCGIKSAEVALIGHPKMFNQKNINNLDALIKKIKQDERFSFETVLNKNGRV